MCFGARVLGACQGAEDYFNHTRADSGFKGLDFRASPLHATGTMYPPLGTSPVGAVAHLQVLAGILSNATNAYHGMYSAHVFAQRVEDIVAAHDASLPLFVYLPFQSVHGPLQAPKPQIKKYAHIQNKPRRTYAAMVSTMDDALGKATSQSPVRGLTGSARCRWCSRSRRRASGTTQCWSSPLTTCQPPYDHSPKCLLTVHTWACRVGPWAVPTISP